MGLFGNIKSNPLKGIPTKTSSDADWINHFDVLEKTFGKKEARTKWLKTWKYRGSSDANTDTLRKAMQDNGITIHAGNLIGSIYSGATSIGDEIGDALKMGKYAAIGLGVIILGGVAILVFNVARKPIETLGAVGNLKR